MYVTCEKDKKSIFISNAAHHHAILLFHIKVSVRSQADDHDKEAVGSQCQTRFAEHVSPPLAALHLLAPSGTP